MIVPDRWIWPLYAIGCLWFGMWTLLLLAALAIMTSVLGGG